MPNLSDRATGLTNVNVISLNELSASPSDPAAGQKRLYAKDDGKVYTLDSDGNEKEVGSGGGASVEVAQSGHGFIIGDVLYFDGTNYVKAIASATNTAEVVGIVSEVVDTDNFVATTAGYIEEGLELDVDGDPLVAGSVYFLSADTAGGLTLNEPNVVGQVSRPVLLVSAARTEEGAADAKGFVLPYRGIVVGGSNARTSLSLNNNGSTDIQDMSDYEAGELSGWVYIDATTPLRFYVEAQVSKNGAGDDYNISYQTSGDTPPSGFDMNVSAAGMVSVVLPSITGFSSANINYSLNAAAVGVDLPLSLDASNIQTGTLPSSVLDSDVYKQDNVVGTVSQVAGVPTGAIIESGSNANGEYFKWADGTMICTFSEIKAIDVNLANNVLYRSDDQPRRNYPQQFTRLDYGSIQLEGGGLSWLVTPLGSLSSTTTAWGGYIILDTNPSTGVSYIIRYFAIGRWY